MLNDLGALTLLGESADWLKDAGGKSIRDHRLSMMDAFRAAWAEPASDTLHQVLRIAMVPLFTALRHNRLYPDEYIFRRNEQGAVRFLPDPENLRMDFEHLRGLVVANKYGIGEVYLFYVTYLLCRSLHIKDFPYDPLIEKKVGDVILLREPNIRANNIGAFSGELLARYHATRILRCMKACGLLDNEPVGKIGQADQAEMRKVLTDELCAPADEFVQKQHHHVFVVLDTASAIEANARAHAGGRAPIDERSPENLFQRLSRHVRRLSRQKHIGPERARRIINLAVAATVRAIVHVDAALGLKMYSWLRRGQHKPSIRHLRMFELLTNDAERLRFLNFLYINGEREWPYYVERFQGCFPEHKLRFVAESDRFTLQRIQKEESRMQNAE